ncbi:MAG: ATP-binding cassette domain-containing protein [Myxococcales bacterium]|nr:ATP-binding cassette domain-containing protein [Myxococcales bacterium]
MLEIRDLRLARGACGPLRARVDPGSIVVIQGPTGVGKTTLLRTLLGLEPPRSGDVLFDGVSIVDAPPGPVARPFAWVPQDAPLLADTLGGNLTLGATAAAAAAGAGGAAEVGRTAEDALRGLHAFGAGHLAGALAASRLGAGERAVSGGERQWIALARAIATCQPVLLLDEPTNGLDAESQRKVLEAIAALRGHRTVLLVTHRPEPLAVADRVLRLSRGTEREEAA